MTSPNKPWDALVVGGGPAGATAALVLARAGLSVLLIDEPASSVRKVGESLPPAARPLLRDLDLLATVDNGAHLPAYGNLSAWGAETLRATDFLRDPHGLGWHLDRRQFDADLRAAACQAGARHVSTRVRAAERHGAHWRVRLAEGEVMARWLVDASGRGAGIARGQGVARHRDVPLTALYRWTEPRMDDTDSHTLVEACEYGWWYSARLPYGGRVVAVHVDPEAAAPIMRTPGAWCALMATTIHLHARLEGARYIDEPRATQANGARLARFAGDGWLAAGDAALAFDPISSQGIFNALYTGMTAARAIVATLAGDTAAIPEYVNRLEEIRAIYRQRVQNTYQAEWRWPQSPFWIRRQGA